MVRGWRHVSVLDVVCGLFCLFGGMDFRLDAMVLAGWRDV